jgi:RNA polymerase sigma-70 factor (ECF subfamily)
MQKALAEVAHGAYKLALQIVKQSADAHDILQEAATIALHHKEAPHYNSSEFKPWFYRVVRNKSIDRFRELSRQPTDIDTHEETYSHSEQQALNPEKQLQIEELKQQITVALDTLPAQQRDIIFLKDYHHMSYADISRVLNIPQGTVMSSLHRARIALRNALQNTEEN